MKIEIIENNKEMIRFKMFNTRHTIPEMLKNELLQNKNISMASYIQKHPEDNEVIFFARANKGNDIKKLINSAITSLKKEIDNFEKGAKTELPKETKTKKTKKK